MTAREIPGALALGLLASLLAHIALYGGGHAMGGAYHELLLDLAAGGTVAFAAAVAALTWNGARRTADGSILATRMTACIPSWGGLVAGTAAWFALGERFDSPHSAAGLLVTLVALGAAAWVVRRVAGAAVRLLARAILRLARLTFAPRLPVRAAAIRIAPAPYRTPLLRRRFARPPPIAGARA